MANPQPDKFLRLSLEVMDAFCRFRIPGEVRQVVDVVIRKTYGWGKKEDWISNSQFVELTGMKKGNVHRSLSKAITNKLVIKSDNAYRFNKNYEEWLSFERTVIKKATVVIKSDNKSLSKRKDTIDNINTITIDNIMQTSSAVIKSDNKYLVLWSELVGTTLRSKLSENVKVAEKIEVTVGEEKLKELLMAIRVIRGGKYNHRGLQIALVNYLGLAKRLEEVEAFIQGQVDQKQVSESSIPNIIRRKK